MTIRHAIKEISELGYFSAAKWAVAHVLNLNSADFVLSLDREISREDEAEIRAILVRLKRNEPMQYVLSRWQFIDIELKTDRRALIPRPETELLALEALECAGKFKNPKIIDMGCGTGCIGLFIKSRLPESKICLCDISDDALSLARENAEALGLDCSISKCDMLTAEKLPCDIMVSNPPYIKTGDIAALDANVKDYEPVSALDGGADGLDFYRALARLADASLSPEGTLLLEIGIGQSGDIKKILEEYFNDIKVIKDLSGIDRVVTARRG